MRKPADVPYAPLDPPKKKIGRLALREEDGWWNAYYAMPDTMEGAIKLGSIRMKFVRDENIKAAFMHLMRVAMESELNAMMGTKPEWTGPEPGR